MDTQRPRPRARRRDSDTVLRASVLDAAIELGIGNKTVAKWMFSPVEEGEEEDELEQVSSLSFFSDISLNPSRYRNTQSRNFPTQRPQLRTSTARSVPFFSLHQPSLNPIRTIHISSTKAQHTPYTSAHLLLPHILIIYLPLPLCARSLITNSGKLNPTVTIPMVVTRATQRERNLKKSPKRRIRMAP